MKIFGYIKPFKDFFFSIPVYYQDGKYYYHKLSDNFIIEDFIEANIPDVNLISIKDQIQVNIGQYGFLVFIGSDKFPLIGRADTEIINIRNHIDFKNLKDSSFVRYELEQVKEKVCKENVNSRDTNAGHLAQLRKKILIDEFNLLPSDLVNLPPEIEKLLEQFLIIIEDKSILSSILESYTDLYLIGCKYLNSFDKEVLEKNIKPEIEKICAEYGNFRSHTIVADAFSEIFPRENHFKKLSSIFLYPFFLTNDRKKHCGVISWGKQTHFSFVVYNKLETYSEWLKIVNDFVPKYAKSNQFAMQNAFDYQKYKSRILEFEFKNPHALDSGPDYIVKLLLELYTNKAGIYTMKGFIFDELISDFSFSHNLHKEYSKLIRPQLEGLEAIKKHKDLSFILESSKTVAGGISDNSILLDPGDLGNEITLKKQYINDKDYSILNLCHRMNIDIGIGFSFNALPFLLRNRNWERIQKKLNDTLVNLVKKDVSILDEFIYNGIRINPIIVNDLLDYKQIKKAI
jgi:hypothetical protein